MCMKVALDLASRGIPVFPLSPLDKTPRIKGGFKNASTDADTIRSWWDQFPNALPGVPTGEASGVDALDIDPDGMGWHEEHEHLLRGTLRHTTRRGGYHYLYLHQEGMRNSAGAIASGVDVRGDGGYIVWWPAVGMEVVQDDPAPWPEDIARMARKKERETVEYTVSEQIPLDGTYSAYVRTALMRECEAIATARPGTIDDTINRAAYSIGGFVGSGELSEHDALTALGAALSRILPSCQNKRKAKKCLERAFAQGKKTPRSVPIQALNTKFEVPEHRPSPAPETPSTPRSLIRSVSEQQILSGIPSGFLRHMVDYTVSISTRPQPLAALGNALGALGAMAGRRYTYRGTYTNIYVAVLLDSGGGKDAPRLAMRRLMSKVEGGMSVLGGDDITSGAAILSMLKDKASCLLTLDEIGDFVRGSMGKNVSPTRADIGKLFKTLYSDSSGVNLGTVYANSADRQQTIYNPCLSISATGVPRSFWQGFDARSIEDGLIARLLVLQPDVAYPDSCDPNPASPPEPLIQYAQRILCGGTMEPLTMITAMDGTMEADPRTLRASDDGVVELQRIRDEEQQMLRRHEGTALTSMIARRREITTKVSMLYAISVDPSDPVITADAVRWADDVVVASIERIYHGTRDHISDTDAQARVQAVRRAFNAIVQANNTGYATGTEIARKLGATLSAQHRREALQELVEMEEIAFTEHKPERGRPSLRYHRV